MSLFVVVCAAGVNANARTRKFRIAEKVSRAKFGWGAIDQYLNGNVSKFYCGPFGQEGF